MTDIIKNVEEIANHADEEVTQCYEGVLANEVKNLG